jgi:hypothetical protein
MANREDILNRCLSGILLRKDCFDSVPAEHAAWICERLAWHKVLPLAAALEDPMKKKCSAIAHTFRATLLKNLAREEFYHAQVAKIFTAFDQADIDYMPFKGPFWGTQLYQAYHWRHIGDIDILLSKPAAKKAAQILISMDYQPDAVEGSLEKEFAVRGELALVPEKRRQNYVPVELHWDLMPSPRFLRKQFIYNSDFTRATISGRWRNLSFSLPTPEIQLFYYLLHATCQHQFMRFVHIANIVHFLETYPQLNWEKIHQLAIERRAEAPLHYGLKFAHTFHPLAAEANKLIRKLRPRLLARVLAKALRPKAIPLSTPQQGKTRRNLFRIAMSI